MGLAGPIKRNDKTNNANKHLCSKIPTGRGQTGCLFTIEAEELNTGLPRNNPAQCSEWDLNPRPPDFKSSASTTWPRCLLVVERFIHQLYRHESLAILILGFLSSKGGKRERVRIEVESLALIWRVINWLILINWLIISLILMITFSMSLRAMRKRSEQLTFHFAELMFYSVKSRCNYIFLWNIVFCNVWLDTSCHIFPQDTSDRTAPLPARTPLCSLRRLGDK